MMWKADLLHIRETPTDLHTDTEIHLGKINTPSMKINIQNITFIILLCRNEPHTVPNASVDILLYMNEWAALNIDPDLFENWLKTFAPYRSLTEGRDVDDVVQLLGANDSLHVEYLTV